MSTQEHVVDAGLLDAVDDFFLDQSGYEVVAHAEHDGLPLDLWKSTAALGFHLVGIAEGHGGSGGHLKDLLAVLRIAARHAAPLPLAETHLAAWLLTESGVALPRDAGHLTIAPGSAQDRVHLDGARITGVVHDVPWASSATRVVALGVDGAGSVVVVSFDPSTCERRPGRDLAGQPRDRLSFVDLPVESAMSPHGPDALAMRGALLRAAQIAGAIEAAAELTRRFTVEREQFGKPVATFQAVQQHLVTLAQAAAMTTLSVERAGLAAARRPASFEICATKLVANENAALAAGAAHQAHGAIGMTREYRLHQFTRRLNTWRGEFGTSAALEARLGNLSSSVPSFAHLVTDNSGPEL